MTIDARKSPCSPIMRFSGGHYENPFDWKQPKNRGVKSDWKQYPPDRWRVRARGGILQHHLIPRVIPNAHLCNHRGAIYFIYIYFSLPPRLIALVDASVVTRTSIAGSGGWVLWPRARVSLSFRQIGKSRDVRSFDRDLMWFYCVGSAANAYVVSAKRCEKRRSFTKFENFFSIKVSLRRDEMTVRCNP